MLPFDFGPGRAFPREVFDQANRNFVLDSLAVRLPNCAKEQHPSVTLTAFLFLQPTSLMSLCHSDFSFRHVRVPNRLYSAGTDSRCKFRKPKTPHSTLPIPEGMCWNRSAAR